MDTKAAAEAAVKERRAHEKDLEAHEAHTEKMKSHAASLKTNKEYQAHLFELELANKKRGDFEEKILLRWRRSTSSRRPRKSFKKNIPRWRRCLPKRSRVWTLRTRSWRQNWLNSNFAIERLQRGLRRRCLDRYNQVKASRKDQPLAAVRDGICVGLSPADPAAAHRASQTLR